jgi:acetylornithine/N-succinyldiaminopimelate aminotransferase
MREKILNMPHVVGIDGLGLMMGIRLDESIISSDVVKKGIENGVLLLTAKAKVRLLPPLNITYDEIDRGLEALEKALS